MARTDPSSHGQPPDIAAPGARYGDGLAVDGDLVAAAERAAKQAVETLGGAEPDLACVFVCGADTDAIAAAGLRAGVVTGAGTVLGCSASGVIGSGRGVEGIPAVSVWAAALPGVRLRSFRLETLRSDDSLAVVGLPERHADDTHALLLADPYSFPVDAFVERCNEVLPGLKFSGGLGAGPEGAGSTRLFLDGRVSSAGAVGVVLGGSAPVAPVVSQGCRPVGPAMVVTRAQGNELLELAGAPALDKLREIVTGLSEADQALVARGLQVGIVVDEYAEQHERGDFLVRGVLGIQAERGGVVIGDIVEVGQTVRFHVRDARTADEDLAEHLLSLRDEDPVGPVQAALLFSCNGRGASLFPSADHDVVAVRTALGAREVAGFFASGEIGPIGGRNHLHGFTASLLAFGSGRGVGTSGAGD
jgi:small ligand-binding sensory domain FIST